ncbi:MAG: RecB family exonuclease [Actinomycetes bacterium]
MAAVDEPAAQTAAAHEPGTVAGSLSPSRASDFMSCPLLYRFRVVDRIPERPSPAAVRGTVVHTVLDELYSLPAADRTPDRALDLVRPAWQTLRRTDPRLAGMFDAATSAEHEGPSPTATISEPAWLAEISRLVERYFLMEDPRRLEPAARELRVHGTLADGLVLRGYVDRLDVAPDGAVRVVDYKTGRSPRPGYEAKALFQVRFYALVLWMTRGRIPDLLLLMYLGDGQVVRDTPDAAALLATRRKVEAVWQAITTARRTGQWQPRPSRLCDYCDHRVRCPAWGGTAPPLPEHDDPVVQVPVIEKTG